MLWCRGVHSKFDGGEGGRLGRLDGGGSGYWSVILTRSQVADDAN